MMSHRIFTLVFRGCGLACWVGLAACDGDKVKPDLPPLIGTLELPISHRSAGAEPQDATRVEIGPSEIRINGETGVMLSNGKVPAAEVNGNILGKVRAKLGEKRVLAISAHAATPYMTLVQVMHTGLTAGAKQLAFKVRKPNSNTDTGWLVVPQSHFITSAEDSKFSESELPEWDGFAKSWEVTVDACQTTQRGDCGYKPSLKAAGGKLELMLRARGAGIAVRFRQTGVVTPALAEQPKPARKSAELLDGIKVAPVAAEEPPPEPSTEHVFTLRADQAAATPSPVTAIMNIVCASQVCPAVVDAEPLGMSGRVLSLIGAAYPDGSSDPKLAWVLPDK